MDFPPGREPFPYSSLCILSLSGPAPHHSGNSTVKVLP